MRSGAVKNTCGSYASGLFCDLKITIPLSFDAVSDRLKIITADRIYDGLGNTLEKTAVVIHADSGLVEALLPVSAVPEAEFWPGSLCPGFINAHGHLELSHLKGRFERHTGLVPFLEQVTLERTAPGQDIQHAIAAAEQELRRNGIVGMGDIANTTDSLAVKLQSPIRFHTFVEVFGMSAGGVGAGLQRGQPVLDAFRRAGEGASFSPHAPYSVHPDLLRRIGELANWLPISIHMQESQAESQLFNEGSGPFTNFYKKLNIPASLPDPGRSSLEATLAALNTPQRLLLVHNTESTSSDLEIALQSPHEIWWCLCPGANRYIENKLPDVNLFRSLAHRVVLGTDSLASNDRLSILDEMIFLSEAYPDLDPALLVQWSSLNAARFFGWEADLGSLEPGKAPGLVHISSATNGSSMGVGSEATLLIGTNSD